MDRAAKESFVNHIKNDFGESSAIAFMSFSKLCVEDMTAFRLSLAKRNIKVKVIKNTLAKRILADSPHKGTIGQHLIGPTMVAYTNGDPVLAAKAIWEWASKKELDLKVKTAIALGQVLEVKAFESLSKLPGKNEMFVSFLWALKSSPTKFLYALQDAPKRLVYAFAALKEKKEKGNPTL